MISLNRVHSRLLGTPGFRDTVLCNEAHPAAVLVAPQAHHQDGRGVALVHVPQQPTKVPRWRSPCIRGPTEKAAQMRALAFRLQGTFDKGPVRFDRTLRKMERDPARKSGSMLIW